MTRLRWEICRRDRVPHAPAPPGALAPPPAQRRPEFSPEISPPPARLAVTAGDRSGVSWWAVGWEAVKGSAVVLVPLAATVALWWWAHPLLALAFLVFWLGVRAVTRPRWVRSSTEVARVSSRTPGRRP